MTLEAARLLPLGGSRHPAWSNGNTARIIRERRSTGRGGSLERRRKGARQCRGTKMSLNRRGLASERLGARAPVTKVGKFCDLEGPMWGVTVINAVAARDMRRSKRGRRPQE